MSRLLVLLALVAISAYPFDRARPGYDFTFPRDHFEHRNFQLEWWYFTGNLRDESGRRFGFELTFFRNALTEARTTDSPWELDQIYLAHFAISDIEGKRFLKRERVNRAGPGLAGASLEQARIWNGNWYVRWLAPDDPLGALRLQAVDEDAQIELALTPRKPAVLQGVEGLSQKAEGAGRASHYIAYTRLDAAGSLTLGVERFTVEGGVWMDHEFSTQSMGEGQVGWDWVSAQLDDGSELMLYQLRREGGVIDPHSSGNYIAPNGSTRHLTARDYRMTPGRTWTSPETGAAYPLVWRLEVPSLGMDVELTTPFDQQEVVSEVATSPTYWEGAIDLRGSHPGEGYLEMTGYDRPIQLGVEE